MHLRSRKLQQVHDRSTSFQSALCMWDRGLCGKTLASGLCTCLCYGVGVKTALWWHHCCDKSKKKCSTKWTTAMTHFGLVLAQTNITATRKCIINFIKWLLLSTEREKAHLPVKLSVGPCKPMHCVFYLFPAVTKWLSPVLLSSWLFIRITRSSC